MRTSRTHVVIAYASSVCLSGIAALVRAALQPVLGDEVAFLTFYLAVVVAEYFFGAGPALAAAAAGGLLGTYYFLPPRHSLAIPDTGTAVALGLYFVVSIAIVVAFERVRRAERQASRARVLLDLAHDAIITTDARRTITGWNAGARELYGWTASEAVGQTLHALLHTEGEISVAQLDALIAERGRWDGELRHIRRDGAAITVESRQVLVRDGGQNAGILEINRDITDRKRAEKALRTSEREYRETFEHANVGIAHVALDGRWLRVNARLPQILGYPEEELMRKTFQDITHPDDVGADIDHAQRLIAGEIDSYSMEKRYVRKDGRTVWATLRVSLVRCEDGTPSHFISVIEDIDDRKRFEEQMRHTQRLESIGVLAGGVAHDFNNLLTTILGNAALILEDARPDQEQALNSIAGAAERAADLTRQMLAYAGKGQFVLRDLDVSRVVAGSIELIRASVPKNIELRVEPGFNLPLIRADATQIQQVVMNLVINAAEATGSGGRIAVRTGSAWIDRSSVMLADSFTPGEHVYISVTDNGAGMDASTLARAFDPFFTTKFTGRGLGLAAVSGIVRAHCGAIAVETAPGRGTAFTVYFPVFHAAVGSRCGESSEIAGTASGPPRILVVDGASDVREFLRRSLERHGYSAATAKDGPEALRAFEDATIELAVVDAVMPEEDGAETIAALRRRRPGLPILVTSGYPHAEVNRMLGVAAEFEFLQKPYKPDELIAKIGSTLGKSTGAFQNRA